MSMHLFSTPIECRQCGATVEDPTRDRCPQCGALLRERRNPSRIAGVERRYRDLRVLIGVIRFLGVSFLVVGALVFIYTTGELTPAQTAGLVLGGLAGAAALFAIAAAFALALDLEENTRASFRLQQLILEELRTGAATGERPVPTPEEK